MSTVTPNDRLTIVKLLAKGKTPEFVAAATSHDRDTVIRVASGHGYPDVDKLAWAADILAKQSADELPAAQHTRQAEMVAPRAVARPAAPAPRPSAPAAPAAPPTDEITRLVAAGKKSTRARTRTLAERAEKAVELLRKEVTAEQDRNREAAARAAEEAKVRAEVARLEAELAAKKALLTKSRAAKGSASTRATVDPKDVRAWAREAGIECAPAGRVPNRVVEAYLERNEKVA